MEKTLTHSHPNRYGHCSHSLSGTKLSSWGCGCSSIAATVAKSKAIIVRSENQISFTIWSWRRFVHAGLRLTMTSSMEIVEPIAKESRDSPVILYFPMMFWLSQKAWPRFSPTGGFILGTPISPAMTPEFMRWRRWQREWSGKGWSKVCLELFKYWNRNML